MTNIDVNENETEKESKAKIKRPVKFDLSDGLQKEDIIALGSGLLQFIWKILRIFLYPFIWIIRVMKRLREFFGLHASERPLTNEEIRLVSSVPLFLSAIGIALGAIVGGFGLIFKPQEVLDRISDISELFAWIGELLTELKDALVDLGVILADLLIALKDFIVNNVFGEDVTLEIPFIALSLIGFIGAIIILMMLESRFIGRIVDRIKETLSFIPKIPWLIYDKFDQWWDVILIKVGKPVMGGDEKLHEMTNVFYRKIIRYVIVFAVVFSLIGLIMFINDERADFESTNDAIYLIAVWFLAGFVAGFPLAFGLVRLLSGVGGGTKYRSTIAPKVIKKAVPASKPTPTAVTSDTTPSAPTEITPAATTPSPAKTMTAKERAKARREARARARKK
ncbi:MAG: hypothetical protein ACXAC7_07050 [Candidatus Hodarchaeales archaeon]|jgi:hypothetical protein